MERIEVIAPYTANTNNNPITTFSHQRLRYFAPMKRALLVIPDDSEAQLFAVLGGPTEIRECGEGNHRFPTDGCAGTRRCAHVHWYSTYIIKDGWLATIDDTNHTENLIEQSQSIFPGTNRLPPGGLKIEQVWREIGGEVV
jgi:hypothetical protein